jgi:hypothetical protein
MGFARLLSSRRKISEEFGARFFGSIGCGRSFACDSCEGANLAPTRLHLVHNR